MIWVTRLNGSEVVVNSDLIETVEATPDTVLTLVDGKKYVVHEGVGEVVDRIRRFRVSLLSAVDTPSTPKSTATLHVLPLADDEGR